MKDARYVRVEVEGTTFAVFPDLGVVQEWGTSRFYEPARDYGYMTADGGRHVALTSYENFGTYPWNAENARHWCERAARAWAKATGGKEARRGHV